MRQEPRGDQVLGGADPDSERGRGLAIVAALADDLRVSGDGTGIRCANRRW